MPSRSEFLAKFRRARPGKNEATRDFALKLAQYYDNAYPDVL